MCGHYVIPSASPHTLLTVSGITMILFTVSVYNPTSEYANTDENSKGLNDDKEQSQSERMLRPAIARVMLAPGLLTII